jgi:hypothetical protein
MAGEMTRREVDPEREMVRRAAPFGPPAVLLALFVGAIVGGWGAAWSAAIGAAIVLANFVVHGLSLSWAARISLTVLSAVAVIGFVARLGTILLIMLLLDRLETFSPLAFLLAVVPATLALLVFEMRLLASGVGQKLILPDREEGLAP